MQGKKQRSKKLIHLQTILLTIISTGTIVYTISQTQLGRGQRVVNTIIVLLLSIIIQFVIIQPKENKDKKMIRVAKYVAKRGLAILTGDIVKDYALLEYVNPEDAVGWLDIEGQTYAPVMRGGRYRKENFLKKPSEFGEVIIKETPYDVVYLEGNAKGKMGDKRHGGFLQLESLKHSLGKSRVKYIDKEGLKNYKVIGVKECSMNEVRQEKIETTEEFIKKIMEITGSRRVLKGGGEGILILQSKTDISITIAILEQEDGLDDK